MSELKVVVYVYYIGGNQCCSYLTLINKKQNKVKTIHTLYKEVICWTLFLMVDNILTLAILILVLCCSVHLSSVKWCIASQHVVGLLLDCCERELALGSGATLPV